jgi:hypothetical protein
MLPSINHNPSSKSGLQRTFFNQSRIMEASQITTDTNHKKTLHRFASPSSNLYNTQNSFMQTLQTLMPREDSTLMAKRRSFVDAAASSHQS